MNCCFFLAKNATDLSSVYAILVPSQLTFWRFSCRQPQIDDCSLIGVTSDRFRGSKQSLTGLKLL